MLSYSGSGYPYIQPPENADVLADWMEAAYPDEFCVSASFAPDFIEELCHGGFIPMATVVPGEGEFLIPKLHVLRSVLEPSAIHVSRTARRESSRYAFSLNEAFDEVLEGCLLAHGDDWLRPPLLNTWRILHACGDRGKARFTSMELRRLSDQKLVAGEIGVFAGGCYTSLTGYTVESGAGTVQLVAAAAYLQRIGAEVWDLGMPLDYKAGLGARNVSRSEFLRLFRRARASKPKALPGRLRARELLDSIGVYKDPISP